ncbi:MAG: hypothetical protein SPJ07_01665 [Bacilli bacterium]|nr:hypothetical protein [Bacilli bacterium]
MNVYDYMKKYETYIKAMYRDARFSQEEYYTLISDIERTTKNLASIIGIHTDIIYDK